MTSGRADETPLTPVIEALKTAGLRKRTLRLHNETAACEAEAGIRLCGPLDLVLLLGDRFEILTAAFGATLAGVPIAHIHGGEASFGSFDNQIRDAVTKLAHIHFVAAERMRDRLLTLGEEPWRIHVVGAPGLDNLVDLPPRVASRDIAPYFIATYHPATLAEKSGIHELLAALDRFDIPVIWTGVNDDPGSEEIRDALRGRDVRDLAPRKYHMLCRQALAVVGNSSSGLIEAPTLLVPTVNVGPRQDGRLKGLSVFNCPEEADAIEKAIEEALEFKGPFYNPYGGPGASAKIARILSEIDLTGIRIKRWSA